MKTLIFSAIILCIFFSSTLATLQDKVDACVNPAVKQAEIDLDKLINATAQKGWNEQIKATTVAAAHTIVNNVIQAAIVCIKNIHSKRITINIINTVQNNLNTQINDEFNVALNTCFNSGGLNQIIACFDTAVRNGCNAALKLIKDAEKQYIPTLADKVDKCIQPRVQQAITDLDKLIDATAAVGLWNNVVKTNTVKKANALIKTQIDAAILCVQGLKSKIITNSMLTEVRNLLNAQIQGEVQDALNTCFNSGNIQAIVKCFDDKVQAGADAAVLMIRQEEIKFHIKK